ncbi:hypothetical protein EAH_00065170, partial [Eimeria acervulina]
MDIHSRYKTEAFSSIDPRFNMRMLLSLVSCRRCLVLDDELNILPINGGEALETASPALQQQQQQRLQQQQQQQELLQQIISKVQHAPPLDALVRLCVSPDQATAVIAFLDCLCSCSSFRSKLQEEASQQQPPAAAAPAAGVGTAAATGAFQTVALTAARGRGKSAALGLAVAAAVALGVSSTFVCAPSAENVQTLFEFVQKGLVAMGLREQADFQVSVETVETGRRGVRGADISGASSTGLYEQQEVKVVSQIEGIGPYTVLLSSTCNGYEGTGRSLSLKLLGELRRGFKGPVNGVGGEKGLRRQLKELSLETPIRYAAGDAVEAWLNQLLCLDCTEAPALNPQ